jgi:uncharacterized protein with PIN domain
MKLLLDGMLGRLAKWLRLLGYDTAYFPNLDDHELVRLARAQGRVLLTRDRELTRRRGMSCLLVESDELEEQIQQAITELHLETEQPFSRCPVCNTPLQEAEKLSVKGRVPPYVFRTKEHFSLCPECDRIYWQGTHWDNMRQEIAHIRSDHPTKDHQTKEEEANCNQ